MFKIKYAGPRPIISQHGISYKDGKEDKYIYIQAALEILLDIDHNYSEQKVYSNYISMKPLNEKDIHNQLIKYDSLLEEEVQQEEKEYESKIEKEIQFVKSSAILTQLEKDTWIENIKLMKDYRIQRAINKIYYFHCINDIVNIILKQRIKEINTPFTEIFLHILHSIQGAVENNKISYHTILEEQTINDKMILKLKIVYDKKY
jgi:hypothetical protein